MITNIKSIKDVVFRGMLIILSVLLLNVSNISAISNFTSSLSPSKSNVLTGETFTIAIVLSGLDSNGLGSANYNVGFNDSLFGYVSTSGSGVSSNLVDSTVKLAFVDMTGGSSPKQNGTFATLTFTAKSTTSATPVLFSLSSAGTKSKTGDNLTSTNSGTSVTISAPRTDKNLTSLSLSSGSLSPSFSADITSYTAIVDASSVSITATAVAGATLTGTGLKNLNDGVNSFNIIVTAEDNSQKTYTINITKKLKADSGNSASSGVANNLSKVNTLKSLTIEGVLLDFNYDTFTYNISVENNITELKISYELSDNKASAVTEGKTALEVGSNEIKIIVTAENGDSKTYFLYVERKAIRTVIKNDDSSIIDEINNKTGDSNIFVIVNESENNKVISAEVLKALSESGKDLVYEVVNKNSGIAYSITIQGSKLDDFDRPFNFNITFASDQVSTLETLAKGKKYIPVNIEFDGKLPAGIIIKIFVADKFVSPVESLYLYYFNTNTNKLELVQENLRIVDGYIELQLNHASEYVLSDEALVATESSSLSKILIGIVSGLIIISLIVAFIVIKKKKIKKLLQTLADFLTSLLHKK